MAEGIVVSRWWRVCADFSRSGALSLFQKADLLRSEIKTITLTNQLILHCDTDFLYKEASNGPGENPGGSSGRLSAGPRI